MGYEQIPLLSLPTPAAPQNESPSLSQRPENAAESSLTGQLQKALRALATAEADLRRRNAALTSALRESEGRVRMLSRNAGTVFGEARPPLSADGVGQGLAIGKRATAALRKAHAELELRVQERTAELERVNAALRAEIAERQRAEAALRESEERYRDLFENANDAITTLTLDGKFVSFNRRTEVMLGYTRDELIGTDFRKIVTTVSAELGDERTRRVLAGEQVPEIFELEVVRKDGRIVPLEARVRFIRDKNRRPIGFHGIYRDVTERRQTEAALERLRQQNELILNSAVEGIFGLDTEGRATFVNPAAARMLGYEVEELLGTFLHEVLHHSRPDGSPYPKEECPLLSTFQDGLVTHVADDVYWRRDGSSFPVEYTSSPMRNVQQQVIGAVVTFQDITQRREVNRMKDELISTVSHELRTPLTSLRGFTELMLRRDFSAEKQREFLHIMHTESKRLTGLINDFLDIQRIEAGHQPYTFAALDLAPRIAEVLKIFVKAEGPHPIRVEMPAQLPAVRADGDRLYQVMENLLSNAIKFSPKGGEIIIGARAEGSEVTAWVTDHGIGIPDDALPKLFNKFYRVDNSETRRIGGTGLGLALIKEIILAHRGRVWVESTLGKGSTFFFTLPVAD